MQPTPVSAVLEAAAACSTLTQSLASHRAQLHAAIKTSSSYTPQAMITLLLAIKARVHPFFDDKTAFTIPLCSKSIVPLVSGYVSSLRRIRLRLQKDRAPCFSPDGAFINKLGIVVTSLQIDGDAPLPAGVLTAPLTWLIIGAVFNQPLAVGVLPASLHSLILGDRFNQPLAAGVLPASLHSLTLGDRFNQPLAVGVLPASLRSLKFKENTDKHNGVLQGFNQPFAIGALPRDLQHLRLPSFYQPVLSFKILPPQLYYLVQEQRDRDEDDEEDEEDADEDEEDEELLSDNAI